MVMPATHRRWTTVDVRALMDESRPWPRYELIGGELLVTPAPDAQHQFAISELLLILGAYVDRGGVGVAVTSPADLELVPGSISQPDIFVVPFASTPSAEGGTSWAFVRSLLLAVEVISPSSVRSDRVEKRDHYMDAGVPEYWVVDLDARVVERWTAPQETPEVLRDELRWRPAGAERALVMHLPDVFDVIFRKLTLTRGR